LNKSKVTTVKEIPPIIERNIRYCAMFKGPSIISSTVFSEYSQKNPMICQLTKNAMPAPMEKVSPARGRYCL